MFTSAYPFHGNPALLHSPFVSKDVAILSQIVSWHWTPKGSFLTCFEVDIMIRLLKRRNHVSLVFEVGADTWYDVCASFRGLFLPCVASSCLTRSRTTPPMRTTTEVRTASVKWRTDSETFRVLEGKATASVGRRARQSSLSKSNGPKVGTGALLSLGILVLWSSEIGRSEDVSHHLRRCIVGRLTPSGLAQRCLSPGLSEVCWDLLHANLRSCGTSYGGISSCFPERSRCEGARVTICCPTVGRGASAHRTCRSKGESVRAGPHKVVLCTGTN